MTKVKYYYDKKSLSYKEINLTFKQKIQNLLIYILSALIITSLSFFVFYSFFDSPKEKKLKSEINFLTTNYQKFESKLLDIETVLDDIQKRDDNIYREIFEAKPIPTEIRKAGFGGVNKYKYLEGFSNTDLLKELDNKFDILKKQLYVQSKSFDQIIELTKDKQISDEEWDELNYSFFNDHEYFTEFGKKYLQPIKDDNLKRIGKGEPKKKNKAESKKIKKLENIYQKMILKE